MKERPIFKTPNGEKRVLLHSCCAPCAGELMLGFIESGIEQCIYFYNPNIHPKDEYELRKQENIRFAEKYDLPFIDADYDTDRWYERTKGLEWEPERGIRCSACFDLRFERTALYAKEHGFDLFTSSLGLSRWKDMEQINASGRRAAQRYGLTYWTYNWRKAGGANRMYEISKDEGFYKQEYCGCVYSLRDTNLWRQKRGGDKLKRGIHFYEK
ncbi:MAG: epoxyqueuosine reductase QueH [bacterium]